MVNSSTKSKGLILVALLGTAIMACTDINTVDRRFLPQVKSAAFYGPNNAWLVTWKGDLLTTRDEGITWRTVQAVGVGRFDDITFVDESNGWATTTDGQVLRTADGGGSWSSIATLGDTRYGPWLGRIRFIDTKHGWIAHPRFFWRTEDAGATWRQYPSPNAPNKSVVYPSFIDPRVGWLSGTGGAFYRTQDGGITWEGDTTGLEDKDLGKANFLNSLVGWIAASPNDGIYHTEDGGKTWSLLEDPGRLFQLNSVQFTSRTEGWAAGNEGETGQHKRKPIVLHTTDGGKNWDRVKVAEDEPFVQELYFTNSTNGWLLSRDNVYRTADGGKTWGIVLRLPPAGEK